MKLRTAIRKSVKWGGAVAVVLLVAVWVASGYWVVKVKITDTTNVEFGLGCFVVGHSDENGAESLTGPERFQLRVQRPAPIFYWAFQQPTSQGPGYIIIWTVIPLWCPILLVVIATSIAWWLDRRPIRRAKRGLCLSCGYDRRGLATGSVCPECGAAAIAGSESPDRGAGV